MSWDDLAAINKLNKKSLLEYNRPFLEVNLPDHTQRSENFANILLSGTFFFSATNLELVSKVPFRMSEAVPVV